MKVTLKEVVLLNFMFLAISSNSMAALSCADVYANSGKLVVPPAPVNGMIEKLISTNRNRMMDIEQSADKLVSQLDQGGSGWKPLNPSLIEKITTAIKEYNHTNFDVMTEQRTAAIESIKTALRESSEFSALDNQSIAKLASTLANENRNLRTPMFGPKHMLYYLLIETNLNQSSALTDILISLQSLGKQGKKVTEDTWKMESMLASGLRGISNLRELEAKLLKVQSEINNDSKIPDDVVSSLVTIAQEYNNSNVGGFDLLTPGHQAAIEKYQRLIRENPFFANINKNQMERLQWTWTNATTAQNAINILSPLVNNKSLDLKRQELQTLAEAIQFFRNYE